MDMGDSMDWLTGELYVQHLFAEMEPFSVDQADLKLTMQPN